MKTYADATKILTERGNQIIEAYHDELEELSVKIDYIYAMSGSGPAITHGGYPAAGLCRVLGLKDRAMGRGDVEILIDKGVWDTLSDKGKDALLDHEITHIEPVKDETGTQQFDGIGRPKLKCRKHDHQFGWFTEIAERYGEDSFEVKQATQILQKDGQQYFPGFLPAQAKKLSVVKPPRKGKKAA